MAVSLVYVLIYALIIFLIAYVVVTLLGRAGVNGTVRTIVYLVAVLIIVVLLLNVVGGLHFASA